MRISQGAERDPASIRPSLSQPTSPSGSLSEGRSPRAQPAPPGRPGARGVCSFCGARIDPATPHYEFTTVPETLRGLLGGKAFCGVACARAFLLETLEVLDCDASGDLVADGDAAASHVRVLIGMMDTELLTADWYRLIA